MKMNHSADTGKQTHLPNPREACLLLRSLYEKCKNFAKISKKTVTNQRLMCP
jgi:hypothetical protein